MVALEALWLPILLSSVIVFIASSLIWMVLPYHKSDWKRFPNEDSVLEEMRKSQLPPGQYMFPFCKDPKEMNSPEVSKKFETGPVGYTVIRPSGKLSMGLPMILTFVYYLVVSFFVAYLTAHTVAAGAHYLQVFRVAGTAAVLTYAGALFPGAIWFGRPWNVVWKDVIDGVIYGLLTAGAFGWLWPR